MNSRVLGIARVGLGLQILAPLSLSGANIGPWGQDVASQPPGSANPELSKYPAAELKTKQLRVRLYLPDAEKGYYRGTRFDWSGLVSTVQAGGHAYFCEFKTEHDPLNHDDICGTAEEFGMTTLPPGFAEARPGQPFVKIGIGVLERADDAPYSFWKRYRVLQPGQWMVRQARDSITFTQRLRGPVGWAYEYTKELRVSEQAPVLTIGRRLRNTGTRTIETDHYGHNFLKIDDVPAGTNYALEFPFVPRLAPDSRPQGLVGIQDRSLLFLQEAPPQKAVWVRLEGFGRLEDNQIAVINRRTGGVLRMSTDQPLARCVFYSSGGVLAPEPFVSFTIPPGQERRWTTTYTFSARQ